MILKKPKFWDNDVPNIFAYLLYPLTFLIQFLNFLKIKPKSKNFKIKTICIGNIYVGGTGKTSLINWMQEHGYFCSKEIVREITKRKREDGHDQYFLSDPLNFSIELFDKRFEEYKKNYNSDYIFYDRGPLDVLAYLDFKNIKIPNDLNNKAKSINYDLSFILHPWQDIYVNDDVRYETFSECEEIHKNLFNKYKEFNIKLISVPNCSVEKRFDFIKKYLN